ncbi:hypothetical protein VP01_401g1 [Puccinia sorghi]|uniref:Uncharacterized protein n=1 Tax=Puccinia sorghi TaxID=27349 RepID=A0A0L6USN5_9BASI|nr:hypothetical protein VP01_401g1 [Puccinia sorghi]
MNTLTEKVDDSKSGWELWVADEHLINNSNTPPSQQQQQQSFPPNKHSKRLSEEASLTGIGSLANYKPIHSNHPDPSIQQQTANTTSSFTYPFILQNDTQQQHSNQRLLTTQPPDSLKKPRSSSSTSPLKPSSIPSISPRPPQRYTHAYELYDRQVSRVKPLTAGVRSSSAVMLSGYSSSQPQSPTLKRAVQPPPAEVCLECMMRDRDMIGIDVVGPGVWARESDADFEEAMRAQADMDDQHSDPDSSAHQNPSTQTTDELVENTPAETGTLNKSRSRKKPLGKGQALTAPALKAWTQMNPPASSHRWRTLQLYLREQRHFLELERKAKRSIDLENEQTEELIRNNADSFAQSPSIRPSLLSPRSDAPFLQNTHQGQLNHRMSSATLLSNGMVLETLDVSKDDKEAAKYRANDNKLGLSSSSPRIYSMSSSAALNSIGQSPRSEPMNLNSLNLPPDSLNSGLTPLPSPTANRQSLAPSSRPPSPHRFSVASRKSAGFAESLRPFSTWGRNRRSASNSVLSLAPSGSMIDMHVGLSQDRHHHPTGSFPSPLIGKPMSKNRSMLNFNQFPTAPIPVQGGYTQKPSLQSLSSSPSASPRVAPAEEPHDTQKKENKKKLRHTLKGLWSKLGLGKEPTCSINQIGTPSSLGSSTPARSRAVANPNPDNEPLAPPPSMSVLAREQLSHRRNRSTLSLPLSNGRRLGAGFRPQSFFTRPVGGIGSTVSSPVSQHFPPPSPGSKQTLNGSLQTCHQSSHINSSHDPPFDSLAEELDMPARQPNQPRSRVRSLGTTSLFTDLATTHEEGGHDDQGHARRATTLDLLRSHEPTVPSPEQLGGEDSLDVTGLAAASVGPRLQSNGLRSHSTSTTNTTDRSPSIRTVLSKSSRIFHKLSGLNTKRSCSGGSLNPLSLSNSAALPPPPMGHPELRTSTSSQSSIPLQSHDLLDSPPPHQQQQQLQLQQLTPQRPDYLPAEKARSGVSRSSDFLALRYVSLNHDDHLDHQHHHP